jgi:hypothetical protein
MFLFVSFLVEKLKNLLEKKVLATEDICWFRSRLLMLSKVNPPYLIGQPVCHGLHETVRENLILKGYQTFRKEFVLPLCLTARNCNRINICGYDKKVSYLIKSKRQNSSNIKGAYPKTA